MEGEEQANRYVGIQKRSRNSKGVNGISEAKTEDRVRLQGTEVPGILWVLIKYLLQVEFSFRSP